MFELRWRTKERKNLAGAVGGQYGSRPVEIIEQYKVLEYREAKGPWHEVPTVLMEEEDAKD